MTTSPFLRLTAATLAAVPLVVLPAGLAHAAGTVRTITAADTTTTSAPPEERFVTTSTAGGGAVSFVEGPGTPPAGTGSLKMATPTGKANLASDTLNTYFAGQPLSALDVLSYATYRDSASTGSASIRPSLQVTIYKSGVTGYANLVFEPYLATNPTTALPALASDVWQTWNTGGATTGWYDGSGDVTAGKTFAALKAANPMARIVGINLNQGSSNDGTVAYADALDVSVGGVAARYDFEAVDGGEAPAPVVPEVPIAVLLPLTALALAGATVWRRRTI